MKSDIGPRRPLPQTGLRLTSRGRRPSMAQAGGTDPEKLPEALASVRAWVEQKL
jgi:alanyl-tRNA synthetase